MSKRSEKLDPREGSIFEERDLWSSLRSVDSCVKEGFDG